MLREIAVPFVQQDLAPAETYAQLADSLEALVAASDSIIDRFITHIAKETGDPSAIARPRGMHSKACTGLTAHVVSGSQTPSTSFRRGCKPSRSSCMSWRRRRASPSQHPAGCPSLLDSRQASGCNSSRVALQSRRTGSGAFTLGQAVKPQMLLLAVRLQRMRAAGTQQLAEPLRSCITFSSWRSSPATQQICRWGVCVRPMLTFPGPSLSLTRRACFASKYRRPD